jgi:hypothetical protein
MKSNRNILPVQKCVDGGARIFLLFCGRPPGEIKGVDGLLLADHEKDYVTYTQLETPCDRPVAICLRGTEER